MIEAAALRLGAGYKRIDLLYLLISRWLQHSLSYKFCLRMQTLEK